MSQLCISMKGVSVYLNKCVHSAFVYEIERQLSELMEQHDSDRKEGVLNG